MTSSCTDAIKNARQEERSRLLPFPPGPQPPPLSFAQETIALCAGAVQVSPLLRGEPVCARYCAGRRRVPAIARGASGCQMTALWVPAIARGAGGCLRQMTALWVVIGALALLASVGAQIPCDEAYGTHCPEASGFGVAECLKKVEPSELSAECLAYVHMHDACHEDLDRHCQGSAFTGDALACLTEWTKPDALSEECKTSLPQKETKKKTMTEQEKKRAAERRKVRKAAEKMARDGEKKSKSKKGKSKGKDKKDL